MKPIERTLTLLKQMFKDEPRFIMGRYGRNGWATCSFNKPLTSHEIESCLPEDNFTLPKDYKHFLTLHNGCGLFKTESDLILELFPLEEMLEMSEEHHSEDGLLSEGNYWIIGQIDEKWILIDKNQCTDAEDSFKKPYITVVHPSDGLDTAVALNLNFECFLERAIIAQGDYFWEWSEDTELTVTYGDTLTYEEIDETLYLEDKK